MSEACCPCDILVHPPPPNIVPGLSVLPRQWAGFFEYRRAMLAAIPTFPALAAWRARGGDDLGVMLLEMWAYVLDVVGFYDARIADESYLRTAILPLSAQQLVALLGYVPTPASSSAATLAVLADGADPVTLPVGTAFRSEAFGDQPPQVFETAADITIWPQRNSWRLAPIRGDIFDGRLLFAPGTVRIAAGQVVVVGEAATRAAARVTALTNEPALDGVTYVRTGLDPSPNALVGETLSGLTVTALIQQANPSPFAASASASGTTVSITLDRVYPQLRTGDLAVADIAGQMIAATISGVSLVTVPVPVGIPTPITIPASGFSPAVTLPKPAAPATRVSLTLDTPPPSGWQDGFLLRFGAADGGTPVLSAKIRIGRDDLSGATAFVGPVEPLGDAPGPTAVQAQGTQAQGTELPGSVTVDAAGNGQFQPGPNLDDFTPLRTPVDLYANLVDVTRGQTVTNEVLGSADASQAFQSFTLKNKPLTYLPDTTTPDRVLPVLQVRVNGLLWQQVPSFFGTGAQDEIYVVRTDPDQTERIVFGDGVHGARPASGASNVVASYRFGAGAAKPPAGTITQISKPMKGLRSVVNPLPASGGSDGDAGEALRVAAPRTALTNGRAVSLDDFQALALAFPGMLNAAAAWAFDGRLQRATVKIWFISDGGDPSAKLLANLRASADPQVPIAVNAAMPVQLNLQVSLEIDPAADPATVRAAVTAALTDPATGLLAPANVTIGRPLFRSEITARLLSVSEVLGAAVMVGGALAPVAFMPGEGCYPDATGLSVG